VNAIGWNCPACGTLLKPDVHIHISERERDAHLPRDILPYDDKLLQTHTYSCPQCNAKYLVVEGTQPRIYFKSAVICIDDGENK
jgi:hypothetical protein